MATVQTQSKHGPNYLGQNSAVRIEVEVLVKVGKEKERDRESERERDLQNMHTIANKLILYWSACNYYWVQECFRGTNHGAQILGGGHFSSFSFYSPLSFSLSFSLSHSHQKRRKEFRTSTVIPHKLSLGQQPPSLLR